MINDNYYQMSEISPLTECAQLWDFTKKIKYLAHLAEPENWKYDYDNLKCEGEEDRKSVSVLYQYIHQTFSKARDENKILEKDNCMIMNTGLLTTSGEQLFMLFETNKCPNASKKWYFLSFYRESDHAIPQSMRSILPSHIDYFENRPSDMYFNSNWKIDVNIDHIIKDGYDRLPKSMQSLDMPSLVIIIDSLIQNMKKRILRNYRLIVPQYYNKKIMYLAPLQYGDEIIPIGIEKHENTYRINTILTLGMAYCNARLLMKPESNWLVNRTK